VAEFKTNRKHMTANNLHKGKALVSDYKDYQPSYMKAVRKPRSDGQSVPGMKAITKSRTGPGRVTEHQEGYTLNYRDAPNYKSVFKKKQTTKKTVKPKADKLGRSEGVPHYATMMAKKLMGGRR
jgi:hypothetical protein